jgi:Tfp pilus assembly protein PilW
MHAIARRLRRLRTDESGLSMTELLVSSIVTMGILLIVTSMFIQTTRITSATMQTRVSNGIAANLVNEISAVLRVSTTNAMANQTVAAPAIVSGTRSSVEVYAFSNTSASSPAPVKIKFALDAQGVVSETRCVGVASNGYWTFTSCVSTKVRKFDGILLPTGTTDQMFTYLDANNQPILIGTGSLSTTDPASPTYVGNVVSIQVIVRAQPVTSKTDPVVIKNTIVLRNLGLDSGS